MTATEGGNKGIVVLGVRSGGTSVATRLLSLLGAQLGSRLTPAVFDRERGFGGHEGLLALNKQVMRELGLAWSWHDLRPMPEGWQDAPAARALQAEIARIVSTELVVHPLWGIKDPRICRLMPLWKPALQAAGGQPRYLVVARHPGEVAASLARRDRLSCEKGLFLWLLHMLEAEQATRDSARAFVTWDGLLRDWKTGAAHIGKALDIEFPVPVASVQEQVEAFIASVPRRQRDAIPDSPATARLAQWATDVYEALAAAESGDTSRLGVLDEVRAAIDSKRRRLTPNMLAGPDHEEFLLACFRQPPGNARPRYSIVIPVFNKVELTQKCLASIAQNTPSGEPSYEVIVVDNASSDGTPGLLAQFGGDLTVWRNAENLGFARATNQGALLANGEILVFLNNDTEVWPGWLQALVHELDTEPTTGIVGGRLLYPNGTIQHAGVAIGRDQIPYHIHRGLAPDHPLVSERREYPVVTAACAALRRDQFYELGLLDEAFVNGHEDIDLCLRYRERGLKAIYRPDCIVVHHESVSEGRMLSREQNVARSFRKWRYQLVQDGFNYAFTEAERGRPERPLRYAIKIGAPDRSHLNWGDVYYAECLAKSLCRMGHRCVIHYLNEWGSDDLDIDVVIHLKGLSEYHPKPYNVNILWMLNHPALHTREELERYDAVLVASLPHAQTLRKQLKVPVHPFLQATDPEHFRPDAGVEKKFDLVFVGNNNGSGRLNMRRIVADLLPTRHRLAVWGAGWDGLLPEGVWQGKFVPWEELPQAYAAGHIVLNDHQPEMQQFGFVNNRTFDAIANGAMVVSDPVAGLDDVLPVAAYTDSKKLHALVDDILANPARHEGRARQLRNRVLKEYTFDQRARELAGILERLPQAFARRESARRTAIDIGVKHPARVSVIVSTYNRRHFLPAAIRSIRAQTYANWELLLVNDGGVDVSDLVAAENDPRIRLIDLPRHHGKPYAVNRGYEQSTGEILAYLDDDDIWFPDHLERLVRPLLTMPTVKYAYCDAYNVALEPDGQGGYREKKRELVHHHQVTIGDLIAVNRIQGISVAHHRDLFERAGRFDERLKVLIDWDMWRRLASIAYPYHVSRVTADHYLREENGTSGSGHLTNLFTHNRIHYLQTRRRVVRKPLPGALDAELSERLERCRRMTVYEFLMEIAPYFEKRGRLDRVRRCYARAAAMVGNKREPHLALGHLELGTGNALAALTHFWKASDIRFEPADYLSLAEAHLSLDRPAAALRCLAEIEPDIRRLAKPQQAQVDRYRPAAWLAGRYADNGDWARVAGNVTDESRPLFQFFLHARRGEEARLADTLDRLWAQRYPAWTLTVIAEFPAPDGALAANDVLQWIEVPAGAAVHEIVNRRIEDSRAEWITFLRAGDRPDSWLLHVCAAHIRRQPSWRLIYTDERLPGTKDRPNRLAFKPDFNLDLLRSMPYIGRVCLVERETLRRAGGLPPCHGAESYDLALRVLDMTGEEAIGHVPELLYEAVTGDETAAAQQAQTALLEHLQRRQAAARVAPGVLPGTFFVDYQHASSPLVSIIIPTRDRLDLLDPCLATLLGKTGYPNYEVLVVDNDSCEPATLTYLEEVVKLDKRVRVLRYPHPYNFAAINNFAAREARGDYLLLLNNDTLIVQDQWLTRMMNQAQRPEVGIVAPRLVFKDKKVQHAGVVLGMGVNGVADHIFYELPMDHPGYLGRAQVAQNYSAVTGACLLIRKSLYEDVGGMDAEALKVLYNDIDLCLKVGARGHKIVWTPFVTVVHFGSASLARDMSPEKLDRSYREQATLWSRWLPKLANDPAYNRNLSLAHTGTPLDTEIVAHWHGHGRDLPRILGVGFGSDGSWHYRVRQPLEAFTRAARADTALVPKHRRRVRMPTVAELERLAPDTLLLHNTVHDLHLEWLEKYRRHNRARLVFGLDDLMTALPPSNPYRDLVYKDYKKRLRTSLALCDRLVVTTEPLGAAFRDMIDDIRVIPNYLEAGEWGTLASRRRAGRKPRVGWAGASQHAGDLEVLHEVVRSLAGEVEWVFFGMCPENLRPLVAEYHAPVSFEEYPQRLAALNLDLALAPLEANAFNEAKSNLRLLEYGALGWPVIASDVEPYRGAPVLRLPNKPQAWIKAIRERVDDLDATARDGDRLRDWVRTHWMLDSHLDAWLATLCPDAGMTAAVPAETASAVA